MLNSIEEYVTAWNAKTTKKRQLLRVDCITSDIIYIDIHAPEPIQGIDEMQALIEKFISRDRSSVNT